MEHEFLEQVIYENSCGRSRIRRSSKMKGIIGTGNGFQEMNEKDDCYFYIFYFIYSDRY